MPKNSPSGGDAGAPFTLPNDLTTLTPEQLAELKAVAEHIMRWAKKLSSAPAAA